MFLSHVSVEEEGVAFLNEDGFDHVCVHDEQHGDPAFIQPCHTTAGNQWGLWCEQKRQLQILTPTPFCIFHGIPCKTRGGPVVRKE